MLDEWQIVKNFYNATVLPIVMYYTGERVANIVCPDQTQQNAASHLGPHCLLNHNFVYPKNWDTLTHAGRVANKTPRSMVSDLDLHCLLRQYPKYPNF